jgi:uncharacterized repeat protein (TIGR03803 family)
LIFRMAPDGDVSVIADGQDNPMLAPLIELPTGELAGVGFGSLGWRDGIDYRFGAVFAVSKAGAYRQLHAFGWIDGTNPFGALVVGSDGGLYGTTFAGGLGGGGVVFRIQPQ